MWSRCFVSPAISYLLLQSKAVLTAHPPLCPLLSILCSAILVNAMHIGVCYRDLPLRPAYCRNPLVSRSRQVMSFLFWGGSMVLRQCFRLKDANFLLLTFFWSSSRQMKKRSMSTLSSASSTCGSFRYCGSVLPQCAIFCRRLISLRNYLLRLMSAQLMSLTAFKTRDVFAQLLLRMMSAQLMSLTTSTSIDTIARKVHVIAETCQMTMNYVPFLR